LVKVANSKIRQEHCPLGENKKAELGSFKKKIIKSAGFMTCNNIVTNVTYKGYHDNLKNFKRSKQIITRRS
jgi:hypothetical protein